MQRTGKKWLSTVVTLVMVMAFLVVAAGVMTLSASAADSVSFAAVGKVDTDAKKAQVLFADGSSQTVAYTGTAPTTGAVHAYTKSGSSYEFTLLTANHDNSDQLAAGSEWMCGIAGSWDGFWNGLLQYYQPAASMPIFIRYSATSWRVITYASDLVAADYYPTPCYFFVADTGTGSAEDKFTALALMVGKCDADGIVKPTADELTPFGGAAIADGNVDLSQITNETAPPAPVVKEEGLCAVGEVASGKAAFLKTDGTVKQATISGTAPVGGELYTYKLLEDDTCSFTLAPMQPGTPTTSNASWLFSAYNNEDNANEVYGGDGKFRVSTDDTAFFVRYSATEWRVFKGKTAIKGNGINFNGYINETAGDPKNTIHYMLIGDYDVTGKKIIPAKAEWSAIFDADGNGWSTGNITVKLAQGGNTPTGVAANLGIVAVVMLLAAVCVAAVGSRMKKKAGSC